MNMQSIGLAITWEFWRKGCWGLLASVMAMIAVPAALLLYLDDAIDLRDQALNALYFTLVTCQLMAFATAVVIAHGQPSRLYARPIATHELVFWQLVPGMAAMFLMYLATTQTINALFDVGWPLWGPALLFAVAW